MFDFEKLDVYKKAKAFNSKIRELLKTTKLDTSTNDQLRRAAFSIVLNLAEASGPIHKTGSQKFLHHRQKFNF